MITVKNQKFEQNFRENKIKEPLTGDKCIEKVKVITEKTMIMFFYCDFSAPSEGRICEPPLSLFLGSFILKTTDNY